MNTETDKEQTAEQQAEPPAENRAEGAFARLWKKLRGVKHLEIYAALVIAAFAILIYFGAGAFAKPAEKTTFEQSEGISADIAAVLENMEGVGKCQVLITYEAQDDKKIAGVIVVAEGGEQVAVRLRIVDAICALLPVDGEHIKVYKMK